MNSPFLGDTKDFDYHIYIIFGITEGILERELKTNVFSEIKDIHPSEKKEDAYFDLIIKLN